MKCIPGSKKKLSNPQFIAFQFNSKQKKYYMLQTKVPSGYCKNRISLSIQNKPPSNISIFIQKNCVSVGKSFKKANNMKNLPETYKIEENHKNENFWIKVVAEN